MNNVDPRPVHIKVGPTVGGKTHFISVLPPQPIRVDERVWAHRERNLDKDPLRYEGMSDLCEYLEAHA